MIILFMVHSEFIYFKNLKIIFIVNYLKKYIMIIIWIIINN